MNRSARGRFTQFNVVPGGVRIYGVELMSRMLNLDLSPIDNLEAWRCENCGNLLAVYTDNLFCYLRCLECQTRMEFANLTSMVEYLLERQAKKK